MRAFVAGAIILTLAACGDEMSDEEKRAAVEASQVPPALALAPEAIRYPDIEEHGIYGASCAFVPDGGGLGAIVIAMAETGYMKFDGEIVRFTPDAGSNELPMGAREKYTDTHHSFVLRLDQSEAAQSGYETLSFPAELQVRNSRDQEVYRAPGLAQCGV